MKKTVVLIAVLLAIVSCEPKVENFNKIENLEKLVREKKLSKSLLMTIATSSNAVATVVIKKSEAPQTWLDEVLVGTTLANADLIYKKRSTLYYANLTTLPDLSAKAKWLEDNASKIDYDQTSKYVEDSHRMYHPELIDELERITDGDFKKVSVANLLALYSTDYHYPTYIEFSFSGTKAIPKKVKKYTADPQLFSALMLKSVIESNGLTPDDSLGVLYIEQYPHGFTCIKIIGKDRIYNYSNEPR
jgi:hypothetical protein